MNRIKILNIALTDQGGAGIASLYFNEILNKAGHQSLLLVKNSKIDNNNVIIFENKIESFLGKLIPKTKAEFQKLFKQKNICKDFDPIYSFFNKNEHKNFQSSKKILSKIPFVPDVIILHSISGFINSLTINELAKETNAKILWLSMDNAPLTGGCHYTWDCTGFYTDCSNCPAIHRKSRKHLAERNLALKGSNLPDNIEIITASELDKLKSLKSLLFKSKKNHKLLFPIDENKFKSGNKLRLKDFFGIPNYKKVIFFGASTFTNIRKGNQYFIDSIGHFQNLLKNEGKKINDFLILIVGHGDDKSFSQVEIPLLKIGYLSEENLIKAYQSSDIFVSTTLEDSGPLMVNQAIMCGIPTVSFGIGVADELVITGITGYKAEYKNSMDIAYGINYLTSLSVHEMKTISTNCRKLGLEKFSLNEAIKEINHILET